MIDALPLPDQTELPGSPLEVVVWQLQFAEPADAVAGAAVGQQIADALASLGSRPHLTRLAPPSFTVAFGAGVPPAGAPAQIPAPPEVSPPNGWQVRTDSLVATVDRAFLALETTRFKDWQHFAEAIHALVAGFATAVTEPPGEQRLGLRYVDRISRPEVQRVPDWADWLAPWLLGPLSHPDLAEVTTAMAQQLDWDAGNGMRATVRQRAFDDMERQGRPTVILDFDVFRDGYRPFAPDDISVATERLNDISHRLFRAAITDRLLDALREDPAAP